MNIALSIRRALALVNEDRKWLANEMGISVQAVSGIATRPATTTTTLETLAKVFNMKVSAFIALGETE